MLKLETTNLLAEFNPQNGSLCRLTSKLSNWDILSQVVSVGSSSMFRNLLAVISAVFLNKLAGDISDAVQAGIGVCTKVMMFPFSIILGFGTGFQPVAGFNWGAKRYDRVLQSFRFSSWVSIIGGVIMALVLGIGADWVIQLFDKSGDTQMLQVGALAIRLQCIALPVHGWVAVVNMLCAGLGNAGGAVALATSRQGSCMLPILFPMAFIWGATGIAAVQAVADVLTLALAIPIALYMLKKIRAAQLADTLTK